MDDLPEQSLLTGQNKSATILVVDDSPPSVQLLELQLSHAGYRVIPAYSGAEALAIVSAQSPDLIILDVMMPGLDGFTVCRQLKADSRTWFIPIILLTALSRVQDRIQGIEAGADDFLSKPFNREELLARVRSLLRLKYAYDALQTERNRLALLYNIGQEINSRLALDEVLGKIVTLTRDALGARMGSIIIFGETPDAAQQIISRVGHPPGMVGPVTPAILQQGLAGWVQQHRTATIVHNAAQDRRWLVLPRNTEAVGSVIATPLIVGEEILGVLLLTHPQTDFFAEDHLTVLTSIATQAAVTVRNARLYEMEQRRRRELELLQAAGVALSAEMNRRALGQLIVQQAAHLLHTSAACLMLLNQEGSHLQAEAWWGLSEQFACSQPIPLDQINPLIQSNKRSFQIADLNRLPADGDLLLPRHESGAPLEGMVSQLSLVLVASGQIMGLLNLYSREARHFDADQVKLAETFAQQAATALANAMLLEQAREEQDKLSAVLSGTTDAVLVVDESDRLILANPAAERTFGLKVEEAIGQPLQGRVPNQMLNIFAHVAAGGQPTSAEVSANGNRTLYISVSPVAGVGQVAVVQDITPLKELEAMRIQAEQEERRRLREIFERYVSPELVDRILAQEAGILERRERRDVVVLFTDLRGFTRLTSSFSPGTVIEVLNDFFTEMVQVVYNHQGTVFDLAGDELMVGFGAPFAQEDATRRALHTAGEMQMAFTQLRHRWQKKLEIDVGLGVGIDQGTVVMGNIGAPSHMNFGMVGDAVNTAHRLVEMAQHGQIIVSEAVVASLGGTLTGWLFEPLPPVEIKGKTAPLCIYLAHPPRSLAREHFS